MKSQPIWIGWSLALFATLCFSIAPPISRGLILSGLNPTQILVIRMAITTMLLFITVVASKPALLRSDAHGRKWSIIIGVINSVGNMCYFWALTLLDASVAAMLMSAAPILVLSFLAMRGEPVTRRHVVRMALALTGIFLLIGPGGAVSPVGVLLIGVTMVTYALQMVLAQWNLAGYDARTTTLYTIGSMFVALLLFWILQGRPWTTPTTDQWLYILVLAVISTYAARLALFSAIGRIGGGQMSLMAPVETLLTIIWSMLFLDERLTPLQWVGGLLVLSSALLAIQRLRRVRVPVRWRLWSRA